jgi:hypothetical protein
VGEVVLVVEGEDPGAVLLAAAFRRHGWQVRLLDLRFGRPTLDGVDEPPTVWIDGRPTRPDAVVNRTATSRLGLAAGSALARQLPATWSARHLAAREEQGLLLACFDLWERTSRVYNPVRTLDRRLLRPAVEAELRAAKLPIGPPREAAGRDGICWIVDGTVVSAATRPGVGKRWSTARLSPETTETVRQVAEIADMRLGQIDLWQPRADPAGTIVTGWRPIPWFRSFWEQTGTDVAALVVAAIVGGPPAAAPSFLAADLEPNLLDHRNLVRRRRT